MSSPKKTDVGSDEQILVLGKLSHGSAANNKTNDTAPNPKLASSASRICGSVRFLSKFGFPARLLLKATKYATANGTTAAAELIAHGGMKERTYFQLLARHLDVRFIETDDIKEVLLRRREPLAALLPNGFVWVYTTDSTLQALAAPSPQLVERLEKIVTASTSTDKFTITSPSILKSVIAKELEPEMTESALNYLSNSDPLSSARSGANAWQGALVMTSILLVIAFSSLRPSATALAIHLMVSSFFLACAALRIFAAMGYCKQKIASLEPTPDKAKPTYSVMVALLDEADVVPDLTKAMQTLKWPRAKLEIKFVCEANDLSTMAALEAEDLDARFEIIKVPDSKPRTKPKALCYALGFTTGKYVTIYDAEDRPHPEQLLEAYAALEGGGGKLACVQAPLVTANPQHNIWTALFHFEYAALFGGLLPWLARNKSPIMLGGTSNHFNRAALLEIGIWDPHNVTEDADLGLRIWRNGYHTDVITRPTLEDAPTNFKTWLPQRTRWFKGWMQTWIVQMRRPLELQANMSWTAFVVTQILLTGSIVSALLHPIVLAKAAVLTFWMVAGASDNLWFTRLEILDWLTVTLAYVGFAVLCWTSTNTATRRKFGAKLMLTPFYWMAISVAAWRGLFQLFRNPFLWEKTPHTPHEK